VRKVIHTLTLLSLTVVYSCKKVYTPQLVSVATNFLAVDGAIISGDSTFIRLSRTTKLTDTTQIKAELKAIVSIESDQKALYPLIEKGKGNYVLGVTNFEKNRTYRLNIKTSDGKIYQSDFVPMKVTPAIDSIYTKQTQADEITFYVDSHDPENNTRYYRWDYKETSAYVSLYRSIYYYKNGKVSVVVKDDPDDVNTCYRFRNSSQLIIGSSAKLAQDVITQQYFTSITDKSEKIAQNYVLQLRQYALTKEGFEYYQNLKKNTEQLGSIFDAQPTLLTGNIHCITSPTDVVIGFISASTITNKQYNLLRANNPLTPPRINFGLEGIQPYAYPPPNYESCVARVDPKSPVGQGDSWGFSGVGPFSSIPPILQNRINRTLGNGDSLLYMIDFDPPPSATWKYAPKKCVDCRVQGGTNIRPAYYPIN
jgi:hypothetical protein